MNLAILELRYMEETENDTTRSCAPATADIFYVLKVKNVYLFTQSEDERRIYSQKKATGIIAFASKVWLINTGIKPWYVTKSKKQTNKK